MGAPRALALCHCFRGALDFQTGNWEAAESALRQAIAEEADPSTAAPVKAIATIDQTMSQLGCDTEWARYESDPPLSRFEPTPL